MGILLLFVGIAMAAPEAKPEAEADADALFYGYYGYARPYAHYGYYGYPGYSRYYGYGGYYGYPYTYGHGYYWGKRDAPEPRQDMQKRDAEAEPEADPYYLFSSYYAPSTYSAVGTYPYAYYANSGGAIHA